MSIRWRQLFQALGDQVRTRGERGADGKMKAVRGSVRCRSEDRHCKTQDNDYKVWVDGKW